MQRFLPIVGRSALLLAWGLLATSTAAALQAAERPPNIVFVLIDDLGWMDLACQGNKLVETPHLDRLATQGMRFTSAYAAAPVCSPTRAAILTGQSPARLHITNHTPDRASFTPPDAKLLPAEMLNHLPAEHTTIAERLKAAGYATAFLGKWHLSGEGRGRPEFEPTNQGFDLNIGGCGYGGPPTFFDPYRIPNLQDRRAGEYLPDRLADEAIEFLRAKQDQPFMLFLWNYTVHWPMEAPAPLLAKYADRKGPGLNDTRYGAMIEGMDRALGRVLAELDRLKLTDDTLLVFTSDNGGFGGVADNRPLRAAKGYLYEGGIRVPLIVRWPGVVAAGATCDAPVISTDFYPTLAEAAGLADDEETPLDGESLTPLLRGSGGLQREAIYFHYPNYAWHRSNRLGSAVRAGRHKLIEWFDDGSLELYDLENDLSERNNLAAKQPDLAAKLQTMLAAWREETGAALPRPRTPQD
ncbi:MAG: sulfatase [Pirellulaceae bacterium]